MWWIRVLPITVCISLLNLLMSLTVISLSLAYDSPPLLFLWIDLLIFRSSIFMYWMHSVIHMGPALFYSKEIEWKPFSEYLSIASTVEWQVGPSQRFYIHSRSENGYRVRRHPGKPQYSSHIRHLASIVPRVLPELIYNNCN